MALTKLQVSLDLHPTTPDRSLMRQIKFWNMESLILSQKASKILSAESQKTHRDMRLALMMVYLTCLDMEATDPNCS